MRIRPFQALRASPGLVASVACLPYDVVTAAEAADAAAGNSSCFFHVTRSEIDLPPGTDPYSDAVYAKAAENFAKLQEEKVLLREDRPCFYIYRQQNGDHVQHGVVACCNVEDYDEGVIKRHETTRPDKETDRARHISELNAHAGPVFLVYRDDGEVDRLVVRVETGGGDLLYDFTSSDGVRHTVWRVAGTAPVRNAFTLIPRCYIADGHHRCAAAARVGAERAAANPDDSGEEEYNWFLAVLFPASQVRVMPYNRLVRDLGGMSRERFLEEVRWRFMVRETDQRVPNAPGAIMMYVDRKWYELTWAPDVHAARADALDAGVLQTRLLGPVLGISDPRKSSRLDFVGGIQGTETLVGRVDSGQAEIAFSMHAVSIEDVMAVSNDGGIMPPKSTWFEPKLRCGLLVHTF